LSKLQYVLKTGGVEDNNKMAKEQVDDNDDGRGLHSSPFQLNLSRS
jgi:hypothetical protein